MTVPSITFIPVIIPTKVAEDDPTRLEQHHASSVEAATARDGNPFDICPSDGKRCKNIPDNSLETNK